MLSVQAILGKFPPPDPRTHGLCEISLISENCHPWESHPSGIDFWQLPTSSSQNRSAHAHVHAHTNPGNEKDSTGFMVGSRQMKGNILISKKIAPSNDISLTLPLKLTQIGFQPVTSNIPRLFKTAFISFQKYMQQMTELDMFAYVQQKRGKRKKKRGRKM